MFRFTRRNRPSKTRGRNLVLRNTFYDVSFRFYTDLRNRLRTRTQNTVNLNVNLNNKFSCGTHSSNAKLNLRFI